MVLETSHASAGPILPMSSLRPTIRTNSQTARRNETIRGIALYDKRSRFPFIVRVDYFADHDNFPSSHPGNIALSFIRLALNHSAPSTTSFTEGWYFAMRLILVLLRASIQPLVS